MANAVFQAGISIIRNQGLTSGDGNTILRVQEDGNLVVYRNGKPAWQGEGVYPHAYRLDFTYDGNLVVFDESNRVTWESKTGSPENRGSRLAVQDDGNVVIYDPNGKPIWATNTAG